MEIIRGAAEIFDRLTDHDSRKVQDLRISVLKALSDNNLIRDKSTFVDYGYVDEVQGNGYFYEELDIVSHRRVRFERRAQEDRSRITIQDTQTGEFFVGSVTDAIVPKVLDRSAEMIAKARKSIIKGPFDHH